MIEKGFTHGEWDDLLRLNESDPQEAVKQFLQNVSRPKEVKSKYPCIKPEPREYNFAVSLYEHGERLTAINLLETLSLTPSSPVSENGLLRFQMVGSKRTKKRPKVNIFVKLFWDPPDLCPLHPVSANDRTKNSPVINPGETYEGFVYFPYLAAWLVNGIDGRLLGV